MNNLHMKKTLNKYNWIEFCIHFARFSFFALSVSDNNRLWLSSNWILFFVSSSLSRKIQIIKLMIPVQNFCNSWVNTNLFIAFLQKSKIDIKLEVCMQMVDSSADECLLTFLMLTLLTESWVMKMFVEKNIWKQVSDTDDTQLLRN